ncbi:FHS family L-fucose permease-like MFS transporter [Sphingobacterium allocomposti]|uniref:FHS family L-fucose permease-like MFS transporter n=1 Tax=Sphingobacterium allocomposti TaxID=415956 RepID=A0A5S5DIM9_9SPHI|nr:L-fucose:H+ symporter permease [Sphingobacterium composti Yoo et al. 2007 non Ten et al. 2007]TYP95833.1 FHS family L-fucose permease-like MFS transporter [Sphingobacterium composti Yoo et al. 2007 non Ten et al. 2007]
MQANTNAQPAAIGAGNRNYLFPFILIVSLFFLWGMAHNLNGVLIPHLKKACQLDNSQSALVDTSVFFAYFVMAIPAGYLLRRWGYKLSIIIGLITFSLGAFLFIPAADLRMYELFLLALFIIGCGLAVLETAANPYAAVLGPPESATHRLNLAASFNGLAAMVAPVVGTIFILSGTSYSESELEAMTETARQAYLTHEASSVKLPYLTLGLVLLIVAILFIFVKLPEIKSSEMTEDPGRKRSFFAVLRHKHLAFAVLAQFFYVGAQVCVTSFFIRMAQQGAGVDEKTAGYYLGVYGLLFMAGRFVGTVLLRYTSAPRLLSMYAFACVLLAATAVFGSGMMVLYALGGLGFFMSIMFPTIFSLGIIGLGNDTKQASSWLIMSIVGGAVFPFLTGDMIDRAGDNAQIGYIVPLVCYLVIFWYAIKGYKVRTDASH